MVECLPGVSKALGCIPRTGNKKERKKKAIARKKWSSCFVPHFFHLKTE
jgi:hypothetical protein